MFKKETIIPRKTWDSYGEIKMNDEEIVERGLIAYCIVFFSEHVMLDIVMAEKLKQKG